MISSGGVWKGEIKNRAKDGSYYWVSSTIMPLVDKTGKSYKYIAVRFDITAQKVLAEDLKMSLIENEHKQGEILQQAEEIRQTLEQLEAIQIELVGQVTAMNNAAIVSETDLQGNITFANDTFCRIAKYSREELMGKNHRILKSGHQPDEIFKVLWDTISSGHYWQGLVKNKAKDGTFYWVQATITPILGRDGKPYKYVSVRFECTKLVESETEIMRQNNEITALNRRLENSMLALEQANQELSTRMDSTQRDIIASIRYARRIQQAMIPTIEKIREALPEGWYVDLCLRPMKDVSGDFYWAGRYRNRFILAVGDGTGHGVPGGFLSLIGMTGLSKLVQERGLVEPAFLLEELDIEVRTALNQQVGVETSNDAIHDSIDMSVLQITDKFDEVAIGMALGFVFYVSENGITELEADRCPVGGGQHENKKFNTRKLTLKPGETLFMLSDGWASQLGGDIKLPKRWGRKAVMSALEDVCTFPPSERLRVFEEKYAEFMGMTEPSDDRILVMLCRS